MQKATVDQAVTHQHGDLLITTSLVETGIHFYVSDGVQRVDELTKTIANREQAAAFYRHVAQAAEQGKRIHQIVWEVQALEEAQNATWRTAEQIAEALKAEIDADHAARVAENNRLMADRDAILAQADPQWRANLRADIMQAAKHANEGGRPVHPTRTRVHVKPLTPAELDLIRHHVDGVITTRPGQSWLVLRAIWRRIGGERTFKPGTQIIASLTLNQAGRKVADEQNEVAA